MPWDFLRRFAKLMGGKILTKLAPRLIIFQYYDRFILELEEKKNKYKFFNKNIPSSIKIYEYL